MQSSHSVVSGAFEHQVQQQLQHSIYIYVWIELEKLRNGEMK